MTTTTIATRVERTLVLCPACGAARPGVLVDPFPAPSAFAVDGKTHLVLGLGTFDHSCGGLT